MWGRRTDTAPSPAGDSTGGNGRSGGSDGGLVVVRVAIVVVAGKRGRRRNVTSATGLLGGLYFVWSDGRTTFISLASEEGLTKSLPQVLHTRKTPSCFHTKPPLSFDDYRVTYYT